ncbi:MAG: hypothetical protein LBE08_04655, partial [Bifidobacteriaceae bacterium]|nr:hypothetical protein [Bifidobacteriaceae bacterium]
MWSGRHRLIGILAAGATALVAFGCDQSADSDDLGLPTSSAVARLNLDRATIELPLDAYGMSEEEQHIVAAAIQFPFFECMTDLEDVPDTILQAARDELEWTPAALDWRYGYWNTSAVAELGWVPVFDGGSP